MQQPEKQPQPHASERDHASMGAPGNTITSSRAGYIPISIEQLPVESLAELPVFVRLAADHPLAQSTKDQGGNGFRLYASPQVRFAELHRRRLREHGVKFVYIRTADHTRFRKQTEARLEAIAIDPSIAAAQRASIVYDTSKELINELLAEPTVASMPALQKVSQSVTSMVVKDETAFAHLFAASHHDFYTATHLINVATWMVPLAHELGHHDPDLLGVVCQAGILHDMGKLGISEHVLNKKGKLSEEEWATIRRHPELGVEYLTKFGNIDPLIARVTLEHHERLDGSGYPRGLKNDDIHEISRICAVVDSFDAMTAFRPFKSRTLSPAEAMELIASETPAKYDPLVVRAWAGLVSKICGEHGRAAAPAPVKPGEGDPDLRRYPRQKFNCHGRMHTLTMEGGTLTAGPGMPIVAHNLSRTGMGILCKTPVPPCEYVRIYLDAKGWTDKPFEAQTIRCRNYRDSWHEIGVQFASFDAGQASKDKAA